MKKIYLRLNSNGKIYLYDSKIGDKSLKMKPGEAVLLSSDQIVEEAKVVELPPESAAEEGTGEIIRVMSAEDRALGRQLKDQANTYIDEAQAMALRHGLSMKILSADLSFDQKKLTFYFCAKGRVDFRSLVLDLARTFNRLIRLQQVGSREEAKYFGGIGKCGRELCCSRFLKNTEQITLEMAETQEIHGAGTSKLAGCCGKLMCCLSYEMGNYNKEAKKNVKESN